MKYLTLYKNQLIKAFFFGLLTITIVGCSVYSENNSCHSNHQDNTDKSYKTPIFHAVTKIQKTETQEIPNKLSDKNTDNIPKLILISAFENCEQSQILWKKGKADEALKMLDNAYKSIIQLENYHDQELTSKKEALRYLISKRIIEIYASKREKIEGPYSAIPVTLNSHVQTHIDYYTTGNGRLHFIDSLKRSGRYYSFIVSELKKEGLPEDLAWLPLVESGFKIKAYSKARALGLWQFISSTGHQFGLKRDRYIDERMDPEKSTRAAIKYLKKLHDIFGDWTTALAAYNCGDARVQSLIKRQKINYMDSFWDLYAVLPRETAQYVPKFLATLYIVNHLKQYGFDSITKYEPIQYDSVKIHKQQSLKKIAKKRNVPFHILARLNPELRYNTLPNKPYLLKVPKNNKEMVIAKFQK